MEPITLEQAKRLQRGDVLHVGVQAITNPHWRGNKTADGLLIANADGTPARYKVTSVHTWKRHPEEVAIGVKRGIREFHAFTHNDLGTLYLPTPTKEQS